MPSTRKVELEFVRQLRNAKDDLVRSNTLSEVSPFDKAPEVLQEVEQMGITPAQRDNVKAMITPETTWEQVSELWNAKTMHEHELGRRNDEIGMKNHPPFRFHR